MSCESVTFVRSSATSPCRRWHPLASTTDRGAYSRRCASIFRPRLRELWDRANANGWGARSSAPCLASAWTPRVSRPTPSATWTSSSSRPTSLVDRGPVLLGTKLLALCAKFAPSRHVRLRASRTDALVEGQRLLLRQETDRLPARRSSSRRARAAAPLAAGVRLALAPRPRRRRRLPSCLLLLLHAPRRGQAASRPTSLSRPPRGTRLVSASAEPSSRSIPTTSGATT